MSNKYKNIKIKILLLIITILILCLIIRLNTYSSYSLSDFIEKDKIKDLTLTVSYVKPSTLTLFPLKKEHLLGEYCDERIVVSGYELCVVKDELYAISEHTPKTIPKTSKGMDVRIHYDIKNKLGVSLLEVLAWSYDGNIYVNGDEVEDNKVYYEVLLPFVNENMTEHLNVHINNVNN